MTNVLSNTQHASCYICFISRGVWRRALRCLGSECPTSSCLWRHNTRNTKQCTTMTPRHAQTTSIYRRGNIQTDALLSLCVMPWGNLKLLLDQELLGFWGEQLVRVFICFIIPVLTARWAESARHTEVLKTTRLFCTARLKIMDKQDTHFCTLMVVVFF